MKYLRNNEEQKALEYIEKTTQAAKQSTCQRKRCGSIIVKDGEIIGQGFNSPPGNFEKQRRCSLDKTSYHLKVTDKTCCVHAEQRAITKALENNPEKLPGSRLYFIRLDENGNPARSGKSYCTICSKMALDVGIDEFVLWHDKGICVYNTDEYNILSYQYCD